MQAIIFGFFDCRVRARLLQFQPVQYRRNAMKVPREKILLTQKEVAKHLKMSVRSVTRLHEKGLPVIMIEINDRPTPRYDLHAINEWLDSQARVKQ